MNRILTRLTRAAAVASGDAQLLDAFLSGRDDQAFRGLVERHGSMVIAVCLRVLRHRQDAEDAFQATFLVLARRAADIWPRSAVGPWLYGVAYRVALKSRSARARRVGREQPLGDTDRAASGEAAPTDLVEAIDRAVHKLPAVYRAAVVACDLEGRSRREAAEQLGWKEGTLSGRLARARQLLADRLRRSGLALPVGGVAAVLGESVPAVGSDVVEKTVRVATGTLAVGVSAPVAALTEGVVRSMVLVKLKTAAIAVMASCAIGFGVWASAGTGIGIGDATVGPVEGGAAKQLASARDRFSQVRDELQTARDEVAQARRELDEAQAKYDAAVHKQFTADNTLKHAFDAWRTAKAEADAVEEKPAEKRHPDLVLMQGQWWILAASEGNQLKPLDPNTASDPRSLSVVVHGDTFNVWPFLPPFRGVVGVSKLVLDPTKTPKHIDLIHEGGRLSGVYELVRAGPNDDVIQLRLMLAPGVRPEAGQPRPAGTVALILGRYVDPKKDPSSNAGIGTRPGEVTPDVATAAERFQLAHVEVEGALKAVRERAQPKDLDDFVLRMQQDKARLDAALQLIEQAELEVLKARLKAKPAPKLPAPANPDARNHIDDARVKSEVERQRDRADAAEAKLAKLAERVKQLQDEREAARAAEQEARDQAERALAAERAAREALEKAGVTPVQTVEVADANGKYLPIPEALQTKIQEKVIAAFLDSGGELAAARGGPPFANADRWTRAEKGPHVKVHLPHKPMWPSSPAGNAAVSDILIPMTDRQAPDYILIHVGDAYRAFFNLPDATVKELQALLGQLKK